MFILPPVKPYRGRRGTDPAGSGVFGASRDGGKRKHMGLDLISVPGDEVVSPIYGIVTRLGWAYSDADLGSIHIEGQDQHDGVTVKMLYARGMEALKTGAKVEPGQTIGTAQDVAAHWLKKGVAGMKNHIHLEVTMQVDPGAYLPSLQDPAVTV